MGPTETNRPRCAVSAQQEATASPRMEGPYMWTTRGVGGALGRPIGVGTALARDGASRDGNFPRGVGSPQGSIFDPRGRQGRDPAFLRGGYGGGISPSGP